MQSPKQMGLFDGKHPKSANISIKDKHELVQLTDLIPWPKLIDVGMNMRASLVKVLVGPEPHYRELLDAIALLSIRQITYRQAEIFNRALCASKISLQSDGFNLEPDHIKIFEFTQMMGPVGMEIFNKQILLNAQAIGILDSSKMMSDTTAQEAMIPYPNEVGLMKRFTDLLGGGLKKVGGKFTKIKSKVKEVATKLKGLVRNSHLFAKTKEAKRKVGKKLCHTTKEIHGLVKSGLKDLQARAKSAKELVLAKHRRLLASTRSRHYGFRLEK